MSRPAVPKDVYMVLDYMDFDLAFLLRERKVVFKDEEVKCLLQQLLRGVEFMHELWIMHRDLKPANLLYNNHGQLKVCDFGLARDYQEPLLPYTQPVVTLYYRCPELLLTNEVGYEYGPAVDMWSVGCIFYEMITGQVLFPARSELEALDLVTAKLGTITESRLPGLS